MSSRIDADRDRLDAALREFARQGRRLAQLGGADRREIGRVGEQHDPGIAGPLVEVDRAFAGVLREIGGGVAESQGCHGRSLDGWKRRFCEATLRRQTNIYLFLYGVLRHKDVQTSRAVKPSWSVMFSARKVDQPPHRRHQRAARGKHGVHDAGARSPARQHLHQAPGSELAARTCSRAARRRRRPATTANLSVSRSSADVARRVREWCAPHRRARPAASWRGRRRPTWRRCPGAARSSHGVVDRPLPLQHARGWPPAAAADAEVLGHQRGAVLDHRPHAQRQVDALLHQVDRPVQRRAFRPAPPDSAP